MLFFFIFIEGCNDLLLSTGILLDSRSVIDKIVNLVLKRTRIAIFSDVVANNRGAKKDQVSSICDISCVNVTFGSIIQMSR